MLLLPLLLLLADAGGLALLSLLLALMLLLATGAWRLRWRTVQRQQQALLQLDQAAIDAMDPRRFEAYVAAVLEARGYRTQLTQASHDLGVDVVASRGTERLAVQVKHYSSAVGGSAIAEVLLGMPHDNCNTCMVVTNSVFTRAARKAARPHPCTLVDREQLALWQAEAQSHDAEIVRHSQMAGR